MEDNNTPSSFSMMKDGLTEIGNLLGLQGRFTIEFGFDQIRIEIERLTKPVKSAEMQVWHSFNEKDYDMIKSAIEVAHMEAHLAITLRRILKQEPTTEETMRERVYRHALSIVKEA